MKLGDIRNKIDKIDRELLVLLQERMGLINRVARERPDLFGLLKKLNSVEGGGVQLDTFEFKKGSPVSIKGQVSNPEQAYQFQENLLKQAGIKGNMTLEKKGEDKKRCFTITFHYKHFTSKESPFSSYKLGVWEL